MAAKTKKKTGKKIYTCKTCGRVTTAKGHLCTPVPQEKTVVCEFCGIVETNTRHVCAPKVLKFKYFCGSCGRVAVSKSSVCAPRRYQRKKLRLKRSQRQNLLPGKQKQRRKSN